MLRKSLLAGLVLAGSFAGEVRAAPPDTTFTLHVQQGLQFDLVRLQVKAGQKVRMVLVNDDDMDHNLVVVKPGTREKVVAAAMEMGESGPARHYLPVTDAILAATRIVAPHQQEALSFTAPETPGVYPYVCTYPGHGLIMYGALYVGKVPLPPFDEDPHIPPARKTAGGAPGAGHHHAAAAPLHPYPLTPPYLYRAFLPDASPAAIAVNLPGGLSFCWDAGVCRLRYAWSGDFLSGVDLWKGKRDTCAVPAGTIFYRDGNEYPFEIGPGQTAATKFLGYRLTALGYPEFHYRLGNTEVYELSEPLPDRSGIVRTFRLPAHKGQLTLHIPSGPDFEVSSPEAIRSGSSWIIPAGKTRNFRLTIRKKS